MTLPDTYTEINETGCCAVPNVGEWDRQEVEFVDRRFLRMHTRNLMFVPLNMSKVMTALNQSAEHAGVMMPPTQALILSRDLSPWRAEQLFEVTAEVPAADNVVLNATFLTRVFEGPYKEAKAWFQEMQNYAAEQGREASRIYFWYTTCPKCAKHYGHNYVVGFAQV